MQLLDWFPSLTTTGLLAAGLWFGRNLLLTRLTKSVEHEFNTKLEALRSQLRESEERFKAELRTKETEIAALRSGTMTALATRQMSLDKRRLEAVDQLWSAVATLGPAKTVSAMMSRIKFEAAAKEAESNPRAREAFELMGFGFDPKALDLAGAMKARPFVTPMVWAKYSALVAANVSAVTRWQLLKSGLGNKGLIDNESINKLLKLALPHQSAFIDKYGPDGYYHLLEELEGSLLTELDAMLAGAQTDRASLQQAAEILKISNEVLAKSAAKTPDA
jgi:hypothetical protein